MQNAQEIKTRIISTIQRLGPILPIPLAREVGMDTLFTSAFLSELVGEKKVFTSNMRVGTTPIYFLKGQEEMLTKYGELHLKGRELQAYHLLKQNNFLKDIQQEPAVRVALRAIKDFAIPEEQNQQLYWKFITQKNEKISVEEEPKKENEEKEIVNIEKTPPEAINPSEKKEEKEEIKSINLEFKEKILKKLEQKQIKLIEETESKKRDYLGIARMNTFVGEMEILIIGKDKKSITQKDFERIYDIVKKEKKLVLLLTTGEIAKNTKEFYRDYKNIILFENLN
jgi:hypothetical protein